jgi:ubiquinone/menaquinone biosynthesis C-methylase UbiE
MNEAKKTELQVSRDHYFKNYDSIERFISYFHQIDITIKTNPKSVLEIGIGNKTVANYLKERGINLITCDFDPKLNPDKVGDIRDLPLEDKSFDTVIACEVLEHIPFSDFEKSLKELKRVSKNNVIISLPYSCMYFENVFKIAIPFFSKKFRFSLKIPYFFVKIEINSKNKEHYWEIGRKNHSKNKVRSIIKKYFSIEKEFYPDLNSNHYFFVLKTQ